jgi:aryl-alcohol dehydrogenase-like predicted oxidoreductase
LKVIASHNGLTVAQLAVCWILRRPEVTAAIVGARRPGQIEETAPAGDWNLDPEAVDEIEGLLAKHRKQINSN